MLVPFWAWLAFPFSVVLSSLLSSPGWSVALTFLGRPGVTVAVCGGQAAGVCVWLGSDKASCPTPTSTKVK